MLEIQWRWVYIYHPRRGRTWLACKSLHFDLKSVLATLIIWSGKLKLCFVFPREQVEESVLSSSVLEERLHE